MNGVSGRSGSSLKGLLSAQLARQHLDQMLSAGLQVEAGRFFGRKGGLGLTKFRGPEDKINSLDKLALGYVNLAKYT